MNERKLLNRKYKNADTGRVKVHSADGSDFYVKRFRGRTVGQLDELRKDRPVIYFKINRYEDYTLQCIQEWINVANELDYDFFFVCDNNKLRYDIIRRCYFKDKNIRFIESMRSELKEVASHLCTPKWLNATYAHLTPFYHAKKNGIRRFWNIDADDTTICAEPKQTAALLKEAEKMSLERGYSAYALDMWRSKTNSVHWSLGVFFVNEITDFVSVFEKEESLAWTKTLEEYDRNFNLDWYMTYLKNTSGIKIGTFYPDNTYFIHWGNFVLNVSGCWVNYWGGRHIYYPIMNSVYRSEELYCKPVGDVDCIDMGWNLADSYAFLENELPICRFFSDKGRKTNCLTAFSVKSKGYIKVR